MPDPSARRSDRTPLYLIGGGVLAVLLVIAAGVGYLAWDRWQDQRAWEAHQRYRELCSKVEPLIKTAAESGYAAESVGTVLADGIPDKWKGLSSDDLRAIRASNLSEAKPALDQIHELETRWERRWHSLKLPLSRN